jgi:hypothetical protein
MFQRKGACFTGKDSEHASEIQRQRTRFRNQDKEHASRGAHTGLQTSRTVASSKTSYTAFRRQSAEKFVIADR